MSDLEEESTTSGPTQLKDQDNYTEWSQEILAKLAEKNLTRYVYKPSLQIRSELIARYNPTGAVLSTATERLKEADILQKHDNQLNHSFSIIYHSLSAYIRRRIPKVGEKVVDWQNPQPKTLWDYLQKEYGASSQVR